MPKKLIFFSLENTRKKTLFCQKENQFWINCLKGTMRFLKNWKVEEHITVWKMPQGFWSDVNSHFCNNDAIQLYVFKFAKFYAQCIKLATKFNITKRFNSILKVNNNPRVISFVVKLMNTRKIDVYFIFSILCFHR